METESNEQVESVTGENPFDGKVTDRLGISVRPR